VRFWHWLVNKNDTMLGIKVHISKGEKVRQWLKRKGLLDVGHVIFSKGGFVYIPVLGQLSDEGKRELAKKAKIEIVDEDFEKARHNRGKRLEEFLEHEKGIQKAYDVLGDIAIISEMNAKDAKKMGKAIMQANKRIKTVLMKKGAVSGIYRTRSYAYVCGEKKYVALYKENGCIFRFDLRRTFFSTRLAYERLRIAKQVKDKEHVMVMFAGVGPFAIEIAKMHKSAKVVAIELNSYAYKSMLENIKLNKTGNVSAVNGDVAKEARKYRQWADRIVMPLPKSAANFFGSVLTAAKDTCTVHYYAFGKPESAMAEQKRLIQKYFSSKNRRVEFLFSRVVRPYSPSEIEIVIDFKLIKQNKYKGK